MFPQYQHWMHLSVFIGWPCKLGDVFLWKGGNQRVMEAEGWMMWTLRGPSCPEMLDKILVQGQGLCVLLSGPLTNGVVGLGEANGWMVGRIHPQLPAGVWVRNRKAWVCPSPSNPVVTCGHPPSPPFPPPGFWWGPGVWCAHKLFCGLVSHP